MRIGKRLFALAALAGVALVVVGVIVGQPPVGIEHGIEGAYLNRSVGAPASAGVFARYLDVHAPGLLDAGNGNLWLGAGVGVLLLSAVLALVARSTYKPS